VALALVVVSRTAAAQSATPTATSTLSAEEVFRKGGEAFLRKDFAQAVILFRQAGEQGNGHAQALLGEMYEFGEGVKKDYAQALFWNRRAADQGIDLGQYDLGMMYANGYGVTQDFDTALQWVQKAAAQGYSLAQQNLEQMQHAVRGPSNDEIIQAAKDRLKHDAIESVKAEYAGVDVLSTDNPFSIFQAKSKAAVTLSLACSVNAPKDRQTCLDKNKTELLAERAARLKELQNSDMGEKFVYAIVKNTRYENNYVAFVNIRPSGSDKTFQWKLLLKFVQGAWSIAERTEQAIN
jgi:TPR repeat protein